MRLFKRFIPICMVSFALVACSPKAAPSAPVATVAQTPTAVVVLAETPAPLATQNVDYCQQCHTDKEKLIALARPKQAASESKGVG